MAQNMFISPVFKNFVRETTGKKPDRDLAIETGTRLLAEGKPVDELLIASLLDTGRYKRKAARSAIRYLSRHFANRVEILNQGGMPVLVPKGVA